MHRFEAQSDDGYVTAAHIDFLRTHKRRPDHVYPRAFHPSRHWCSSRRWRRTRDGGSRRPRVADHAACSPILDGCQICDEPEPEKHHFHPWECDDEDTGCYSCDVGAPGNQGCHPSEQNQTCNQWHAHCSVMAFAETLDDAYDARNLGQIAEMVAAEPDAYLLHSARQSLQMYDCNGDIVGNLTFRDHEFNALTILIQQAAPEPF